MMLPLPDSKKSNALLDITIDSKRSISTSSKTDESVTFGIIIPSESGVTSLLLKRENETFPFIWADTTKGNDRYILSIKKSFTKSLGHFYFEIILFIGTQRLYLNKNSQELFGEKYRFELTEKEQEGKLFIFTVTDNIPPAPKGAVYHIFTDRFKKTIPFTRFDSKYNPDWENGIPEYAQKDGDFIENNTHFGGSFDGIEEKLDHIESLSAEFIYLSPISKAFSNHKYDVGDYMTVDECLGGEDKLKSLIKSCHNRGIKVIIDSVFNHTGDNSKYFNKFGSYNSVGAYQSSNSEYYDWYNFKSGRDNYDCWWGVKCMPSIKKGCTDFIEFVCGNGGVIDYYMSELDADGLRLDVADELTVAFVKEIKKAVIRNKKNGIVIGEVWENATRKNAYNEDKYYFDYGKLDSVTNYPLMDGIIEFSKNGYTDKLKKAITDIYCDYPFGNSLLLFNIISTHDTWRAITKIGGEEPLTKNEKAIYRITGDKLDNTIEKMKTATLLQVFLPGTPCIYYGDEIGMQGFEDPFCRMPMRWHDVSEDLLEWYRKILYIRKNNRPLYEGGLDLKLCENGIIVFDRYKDSERIRVLINASNEDYRIKVEGYDLLTESEIKYVILKSQEKRILLLK